jgi:hypothetical protein
VFTAVVRISGAGRLADFRERLRWLMVRDAESEDYTEHHGEGVLEYRFMPRKGIPFPAFAQASADFPELRVEAQWERDGVKGSAVIEQGRLLEQESGAPGAARIDVEVGDSARLELAIACVEEGGACAGYAVSAEQQTYFRFKDGVLELVGTDEADAELEDLAFAFVGEWVWFDEENGEDATLERTRYAGYGYPVRGANLKSKQLAFLRGRDGRYGTLGEAGRLAREALKRQWQNPG